MDAFIVFIVATLNPVRILFEENRTFNFRLAGRNLNLSVSIIIWFNHSYNAYKCKLNSSSLEWIFYEVQYRKS